MTSKDDDVSAGRGFLLIAGAKVWFILTSSAVALGLPRLFGEPESFGRFKVVSSVATIVNMVLITATVQAVSRLTSERPAGSRALRRMALRLQAVIGGGVSLLLFALAEPIAAGLLDDASYAPYLRIASIVTAAYAAYAVFVGLLNGLAKFATQAALDMAFSTMKALFILGCVALGLGVSGAFMGFALAAVTIAAASAMVTGRRLPPELDADAPDRARYLRLLWPIAVSSLLLNFIIQLDVLMVKGLPDASVHGADAVDRISGLFGGAKNLSLLPYQATFALTFVVFPMLSKAGFAGDMERVRQWIRQSTRFTLLLGTGTAVVLLATAEPALRILMGPDYAAAAPALTWLLPSTVCLAELVLGITMLNASGHERAAMWVAVSTLAALGAAQWFAAQSALDRSGLHALPEAAALGTLTACVTGLLVVSVVMRRLFGAAMSPWMTLRVGVAAAAAFGMRFALSASSLVGLVLLALATGVVYVMSLFVVRELTGTDLALIKRILGKSKAA